MKKLLLLTIFIGLSFAFSADALWYSSSWSKRKPITIDNSQMSNNGIISASYSNFPVFIDITSETDIGGSAQADGDDIRFTSSDGETLLSFEEEYFNITTGTATGHFWVEVPSLNADADTSSNDTIYIYYGNADASDGQDAEAVWDANYVMVQHLVDSTTQSTSDSTSNSNDGYKKAANEPIEATGKIYQGQDFDGTDDYVNVGSIVGESVESADAFTISTWANCDDLTADNTVVARWDADSAAQRQFIMWMDTDDGADGWAIATFDRVAYKLTGHTVASAIQDQWQHIVTTFDGTTQKTYVDGAEKDSDAGAMQAVAINVYIGDRVGSENPFNGTIDEVRISNTARSADWIKFEYFNMNESDNELSWGAEETETPSERNRLMIIK